MYRILSDILSDKKGGAVFTCFGIWHLFYISLFIMIAIVSFYLIKSKSSERKSKVIERFANIAFGLYISDFFLMPLAYGEIDIEKLPFHVCTSMCVTCFLSNHVDFLKKYKWNFALLGFISNLVYLLYPAGVMWHMTHPLSYRVIQTLVFHGVMTVYGFLVLAFESRDVKFKDCYKDLTVLCAMTLWALAGNFIYNGEVGEYSHFFNWFFVVRDPFYILPKNISRFVMPILNIAIFFSAELLIRLIIHRIKGAKRWTTIT